MPFGSVPCLSYVGAIPPRSGHITSTSHPSMGYLIRFKNNLAPVSHQHSLPRRIQSVDHSLICYLSGTSDPFALCGQPTGQKFSSPGPGVEEGSPMINMFPVHLQVHIHICLQIRIAGTAKIKLPSGEQYYIKSKIIEHHHPQNSQCIHFLLLFWKRAFAFSEMNQLLFNDEFRISMEMRYGAIQYTGIFLRGRRGQ